MPRQRKRTQITVGSAARDRSVQSLRDARETAQLVRQEAIGADAPGVIWQVRRHQEWMRSQRQRRWLDDNRSSGGRSFWLQISKRAPFVLVSYNH